MTGERRPWDAIVVGASFGGLAAAMELAGSGRVLLIDRSPVGEGQTSACATPLSVLDRLSAADGVEQIHNEILIHGPGGIVTCVVPQHPFATFNYQALCRILLGRTDAAFLQAAVLHRNGEEIVTNEGSFRARVLIDASGWRSVLAHPGGPQHRHSLGIEVTIPAHGEGLRLWLRPPQLDCGMAWVFPAGDRSRVGVACYLGKGRLKDRLEAFAPIAVNSRVHGGSFTSRLAAPTLPGVFRVGDAAGQCLPVTGEGIRPALVFGQLAGRPARRVIEGESSIDAALRDYRRTVRLRAPYYSFLGAVQDVLLAMPTRFASSFTALIANCFKTSPGQATYWWAADPLSLDMGARSLSLIPETVHGRAGA